MWPTQVGAPTGSKMGVLQQAVRPSQTTGLGAAEFVVYHKVTQKDPQEVSCPTSNQVMVSSEVRPGCSGLYPVGSWKKNLQGWKLHCLSGQGMTVLIMKKFLSGFLVEMCNLSSSCRLRFAYIPPRAHDTGVCTLLESLRAVPCLGPAAEHPHLLSLC